MCKFNASVVNRMPTLFQVTGVILYYMANRMYQNKKDTPVPNKQPVWTGNVVLF